MIGVKIGPAIAKAILTFGASAEISEPLNILKYFVNKKKLNYNFRLII